jgi:ankyrin repeat protein
MLFIVITDADALLFLKDIGGNRFMNLLRASSKGDLAAVKKLVADGSDVNAADTKGRTPLIEAAWAGHADVVKYLIEKGAKVDAADSAGYTALMRACEEGHGPVVTYLINKGADVNVRGKVRGTTSLMLAAEQGHIKILEALIAHGAKVNAVDQFEETALARAYYTEQTKSAEFLESKGGRGKPERSSLSHYSSRDRDGKPYTKAALPQWSAAAFESDMAEETESPEEAAGGSEEMFEE